METKEFGARLREVREQAGLSQRDLADKVGVNFTYLSKIESGAMPPPSEKVILRLAEVLKADRDELMTLAGKVPSDIVQILKNREALRFLRAGRTQKKLGAANKNESFNIRLRELREQAGLSQRELADKVGVNFSYLSKIESGVMPPPSEKVILRLAEVLKADRDELMTLAGKVPSDIIQILKNREALQFLRAGRTQKKLGAANKKEGINMGINMGINIMKHLVNYKRLSRVAIAAVLVCAVATSLWYASPLPVKALMMEITDLEGNPIEDTHGTLGETYDFQVKVTIEDYEFLPIQYVDLSIFKTADASTYNATCTDLPLIDGVTKYYSDEDTGEGGTVNITATESLSVSVSGYGYAIWEEVKYPFEDGIGYIGSITYSIAWTPPSGWTGGGYTIEAKITADGTTFTQTSAEFSLSPAPVVTESPVAETSISQALDASGVAVVRVNIDRIRDATTGLTALLPGGIGSYEATVTAAPGSGIEILAVRGVAPFENLTFVSATGVFSVDSVSTPPQADNTPVAEIVLRLVGDCLTSYDLTVAFQAIGDAAESELNVVIEQPNTITFLRGDANGSGGVSMTDAMFTAQFAVKVKTLDQLNALNAASVKYDSTNGSGDKISMTDAMFIAQRNVNFKDDYFIAK